MSKIGVGVGEDFPVDEKNRPETETQPEAEDLGTCHSRNEARREAWRRFRHQMHEEWHARRRAWRDSRGARDGVEAIHDFREKHLHHLIIGGLAVLGLAAILAGLRHRD
jgi:hypothetical protein